MKIIIVVLLALTSTSAFAGTSYKCVGDKISFTFIDLENKDCNKEI